MKRKINIFLPALLVFVTTTAFSQQQFKQITVDDLWVNWSFWPNSVDGLRSMNDGIHYTTLDRDGQIVQFSYETGKSVKTVLNTADLKIGGVDEYEFNADESKMLLQTAVSPIYRRSFTAEYYIYELNNRKLTKLSENGKQQVASFSPDGTKVAFVRSNNLFFKDLSTNNETQITNDGKFNEIINGVPDWVYEEEFEFNQAYSWSPDSKKLAFIKFDESNVKTFDMIYFAGQAPRKKDYALYPFDYTFKYPKAGEANSLVSVNVYDLSSTKTKTMDIGAETDIYIPRIRWTKSPDKLSIFRLNRLQNKFDLLFADPNSGISTVIFSETNKYYIDETDFDNLQFLPDGKSFVMTSERDGYRHLFLHDLNGKQTALLTPGNYDLTQYIGFDEAKKIFYYQSAEESPSERAIYSVDMNGTKKVKISTQKGTNDAEFSSNFKYYINTFSNSQTPPYITLHDSKGKIIRVLEDNAALKNSVAEYGGANKEFFSFKTSENVELNGWMIKPTNFDATKKYPVIVTQYSGPGSQEVLNSWSFGWDELLAQKGIIVVCVDSRGTGARGEEFKKITYLQMGKYETIDLGETAKYLQTQNYVDAAKIGIWGWSYGGFMTSLCMTKNADLYSSGIAVAPVTNWRYYDNIYTERFMRTPQENPGGYDGNSPINFAKLMKGNFMLIHGTADDNVHWQNSAEFSEALVQANVAFSQFFFTNRNHSIYGGNTRKYLYEMMLKFWEKNLLN